MARRTNGNGYTLNGGGRRDARARALASKAVEASETLAASRTGETAARKAARAASESAREAPRAAGPSGRERGPGRSPGELPRSGSPAAARGSERGPGRSPGRIPRSGSPAAGEPDERAIAREVAARIRALLTDLGLERYIGAISPRELAAGLLEWLTRLVPTARAHALSSLANLLGSEYLQPDTWKGLFHLAQNAVESSRESRARRARGDYETDDFGFDEEFFLKCLPFTRFLYEKWWRVDVTGLENVPDDKRSLIVANHSGVLPFDGAMISQAIWSHHRAPRPVRWLYLKWFASLPFVSIMLARAGGAMACPENGERLLEQDRLVGVFPEGLKGVGKLFRDRYTLARFGRGGFMKMAMSTRAPIIPVSVVGAEETYPALTYLEFISKPLGMPMLPITPTFPWLGLLGLVPLPSKWSIHFGTPVRFNENAPAKVDDFLIVSLLTEKVRDQIQSQINDQLKLRKSVFF